MDRVAGGHVRGRPEHGQVRPPTGNAVAPAKNRQRAQRMHRTDGLLKRTPPQFERDAHPLLEPRPQMGQHGQSLLDSLNGTLQKHILPQSLDRHPHLANPGTQGQAQAHFKIITSLHGPRHQRGRIEKTAPLNR